MLPDDRRQRLPDPRGRGRHRRRWSNSSWSSSRRSRASRRSAPALRSSRCATRRRCRCRQRRPEIAFGLTGRSRRRRSCVMTMVAERGARVPPSGQWLLKCAGLAMFGRRVVSPGCWMLTNSAGRRAISAMPVISQSFGPTRKRRRPSVARRLADVGRLTVVVRRAVDVGDGLRAAVADLARQRRQHHAVGHVGVGAVVGLEPQQAGVAWLNHRPSGLEKSLSAVRPDTLTLARSRWRARRTGRCPT